MLLGCLKCFVVPQPLLCSDKRTIHLITGVGILLHLIFSSCLNLPRVTESHITFLCVSLNPGLAFRLSRMDVATLALGLFVNMQLLLTHFYLTMIDQTLVKS